MDFAIIDKTDGQIMNAVCSDDDISSDEIIPMKEGFWIGDFVIDGKFYHKNERPNTLEERVETLEAENEMISDVLDALLMGDLEV